MTHEEMLAVCKEMSACKVDTIEPAPGYKFLRATFQLPIVDQGMVWHEFTEPISYGSNIEEIAEQLIQRVYNAIELRA